MRGNLFFYISSDFFRIIIKSSQKRGILWSVNGKGVNHIMNNNDFSQNTSPESDQSKNQTNQNRTSAENGFPPIENPQWYGVSYQNEQANFNGTATRKKNGKKKKIALIAAIVAVCVLFSSLMLLGGAMVAKRILAGNGGGNQTDAPYLSDTNTDADKTQSVIHDSGAATRDYSTTILPKNENTEGPTVNGSVQGTPKTLIQAVADVQDSVVEIVTAKRSGYGTISQGAGSGVIIDKSGIIITNNHVVEGYTDIHIIVTDHSKTDGGAYQQTEYEATVRGSDENSDIAILTITPAAELTAAPIGKSANLLAGETVFAIGNPLGELGGTVTRGIISATSRQVTMETGETMTLLQTDAAINSGNSGGGLFNLAGELIGIVNAKYSATGVEGLGFAIPIDAAMKSADDLWQYGYVRGVPAINAEFAEKYFSTSIGWQKVLKVYVYDAGSNGVLETGDIILSVDGVSISTKAELKKIVSSHQVGDTLEVYIQRNGKTMTVTVPLTENKPKGQ